MTLLPKNPTKPTNTTSIINGQQLEALSSCGSCCGPGRDRQPLDSVLVSLFDVSPLGDADPEANQIRQTQRTETEESTFLSFKKGTERAQ